VRQHRVVRRVNRGELWWADLAEPRGSEPGRNGGVVRQP
jgi:mRNA-degrading endonuclease toxin of MazEF toxin-antitoxin module